MRSTAALGLALAVGTALAACQPAAAPTIAPAAEPAMTAAATAMEPATPSGAVGAVDPAAVTGDVVMAGSSTVYPLAEALGELFYDQGYTGKINIDSIGSGAGFERFCTAGETDVANASRAINDKEIAACKAINREPLELRVGTDALAVVVNPANDWITDATKEELATLFSTAVKWSDVNPAWPAEDIQRFIPGTDSGTFDFFVESIFAKDKEPILSSSNTQMSEDDNVLVRGIEESANAIGFFGYAYYEENKDKLKILDVGGVTPGLETATDGTYPLARPLFMYTDAGVLKEKPQVGAFLQFVLDNVNSEIERVGYFPAPPEAIAGAMGALQTAEQN